MNEIRLESVTRYLQNASQNISNWLKRPPNRRKTQTALLCAILVTTLMSIPHESTVEEPSTALKDFSYLPKNSVPEVVLKIFGKIPSFRGDQDCWLVRNSRVFGENSFYYCLSSRSDIYCAGAETLLKYAEKTCKAILS